MQYYYVANITFTSDGQDLIKRPWEDREESSIPKVKQ